MLMRKHQGNRTAKELAQEFGISAPYLSEIFKGTREPGPNVLEKLGLGKETLYRELVHD